MMERIVSAVFIYYVTESLLSHSIYYRFERVPFRTFGGGGREGGVLPAVLPGTFVCMNVLTVYVCTCKKVSEERVQWGSSEI